MIVFRDVNSIPFVRLTHHSCGSVKDVSIYVLLCNLCIESMFGVLKIRYISRVSSRLRTPSSMNRVGQQLAIPPAWIRLCYMLVSSDQLRFWDCLPRLTSWLHCSRVTILEQVEDALKSI